MAAEYCRLQKKNFFFRGRARQEILKIEIFTWNKKTNFFLMFIRFPSEVPETIKNIHFCKNGEHVYVTLDFRPKKRR